MGPELAPEQEEARGQELEQGSFRDRDSRVFYKAGEVYRGLSTQGLREWERLSATKYFARLLEEGKVVGTERIQLEEAPDPALAETWEAILRHHTIPFVSYPYEWSFGMLKDAALLQLEVIEAALEEDMVLKDATPYNVQWDGAAPVFIDVPSFVDLKPGEPWPGYRQFCELFLYPLMLQAYKGAPFHPWLRGSIDGITAEAFRGLMSWRDKWRPGVFLHVSLQAMLQSKHADTKKDVKKELKASGFHKELIVANVKKLTKLIGGLEWKQGQSTWSDYIDTNSYDDANRKRKADFVRAATLDRPRDLVWDLGCNTGEYSRIAAESAGYVVSMDADHLAVERMYQALKAEQNDKILPLTVNLADSSPNLGWRGAERKDLRGRGAPSLTLALALIHHIVIGANVPLREFVDWLAGLGSDLVLEFVNKDDEMVRTLLRNKEDKYTDYEQPVLEDALSKWFDVERKETLAGETRILYYARRR
jgi:hypothetical protein